MAEGLSNIGSLGAGLIGAITGVLVAILGFFTHRRRASISESALVLGEWKKLLDEWKDRVDALVSRVKHLEDENSLLRERVTVLEGELSEVKSMHRATEDENAGLRRLIAQLSRDHLTEIDPDSHTAKAINRVIKAREKNGDH